MVLACPPGHDPFDLERSSQHLTRVTVNEGIAPPGDFDEFYADRDWTFYSWILAQAILHSGPGPILDVGAGTGFLTEAAQRWGLDCEGLEGSTEGIELAHKRYPPIRLRAHLLSEPLPYD